MPKRGSVVPDPIRSCWPELSVALFLRFPLSSMLVVALLVLSRGKLRLIGIRHRDARPRIGREAAPLQWQDDAAHGAGHAQEDEGAPV